MAWSNRVRLRADVRSLLSVGRGNRVRREKTERRTEHNRRGRPDVQYAYYTIYKDRYFSATLSLAVSYSRGVASAVAAWACRRARCAVSPIHPHIVPYLHAPSSLSVYILHIVLKNTRNRANPGFFPPAMAAHAQQPRAAYLTAKGNRGLHSTQQPPIRRIPLHSPHPCRAQLLARQSHRPGHAWPAGFGE